MIFGDRHRKNRKVTKTEVAQRMLGSLCVRSPQDAAQLIEGAQKELGPIPAYMGSSAIRELRHNNLIRGELVPREGVEDPKEGAIGDWKSIYYPTDEGLRQREMDIATIMGSGASNQVLPGDSGILPA